jgi:hypothetical protein
MKFIHLTICFLILATLNSCRKENSLSTKQTKSEITIFQKYSEMSLPYIDSTNFDNFDSRKNYLTKTEIEYLKLVQIFSNLNYSKGAKFFIKHRISLSKKYNSIVVICASENEMYTVLINFNNQLKVIDFKEIGYDEIAESCYRKISKISKNNIEVTERDFCEGSTTIENYEIKSNGKVKISL